MILCKHRDLIEPGLGTMFDEVHKPGDTPPYSGIYRCEACGEGIAANGGNPLPPQNHHQHAPDKGPIRWRLLVWA